MVRELIALLNLSFAWTVAAAQSPAPDDVAHRVDRRRTAELNHDVAVAVARRERGSADRQSSYQAAREAYRRDLADWRARVEACQRGDWERCR